MYKKLIMVSLILTLLASCQGFASAQEEKHADWGWASIMSMMSPGSAQLYLYYKSREGKYLLDSLILGYSYEGVRKWGKEHLLQVGPFRLNIPEFLGWMGALWLTWSQVSDYNRQVDEKLKLQKEKLEAKKERCPACGTILEEDWALCPMCGVLPKKRQEEKENPLNIVWLMYYREELRENIEAIEDLRNRLKEKPEDAYLRYKLGIKYLERSGIESAMEHYENPGRAIEYYEMKKKEKGWDGKALEELKKAVELNPELREAQSQLGSFYFDRELYDEAIEHLKKAIKLYPKGYYDRYLLVSAYQKKGLWDLAIKECRKMIQWDPSDGQRYHCLGYTYEKMGKREEAIVAFRKALELGDSSAAYNLYWLGEKVTLPGTFLSGFWVCWLTITPEIAGAINLPEPKGLFVEGVNVPSPASKVGIRRGDILLQIDGQPVNDFEEFRKQMDTKKMGEIVKLTIWRKGETKEVELKLEEPKKWGFQN